MGQESFSFSASEVRRQAAHRRGPTDRAPEPEPGRESGSPADAAPDDASSERAPEPAEAPALTVSQLSEEIDARLRAVGRVRVEGEVSGLRSPSSGHLYFDLKDDKALVSCVMWRSQVRRALSTKLADGMQVLVHGKLEVYGPHGRYKLIVERVEPLGLGALLARLEELKAELRALGWFDRHRPLPSFPRTIGVVTSRDGAALRDVLRTRTLRWPLYPLRFRHASVQGPDAAVDIARAIAELDASGVDVIVVTRGGGSLQDLWCFNERVVAEAIWNASVPVVSGVGHESDTSLADLVADHRAHTPTDAAQTVIPDRDEVLARLERAAGRLLEGIEAQVEVRASRLATLARSRVMRAPLTLLTDRAGRLARSRARLSLASRGVLERSGERLARLRSALDRQAPARRIEAASGRLDAAHRRLATAVVRSVEARDRSVALAARSLEAISPLAVLGRGYSITTTAGGAALRDASDAQAGDRVETRLARGRLVSRVEEVRPESATDVAGGAGNLGNAAQGPEGRPGPQGDRPGEP